MVLIDFSLICGKCLFFVLVIWHIIISICHYVLLYKSVMLGNSKTMVGTLITHCLRKYSDYSVLAFVSSSLNYVQWKARNVKNWLETFLCSRIVNIIERILYCSVTSDCLWQFMLNIIMFHNKIFIYIIYKYIFVRSCYLCFLAVSGTV
jgi:hypothetical protein